MSDVMIEKACVKCGKKFKTTTVWDWITECEECDEIDMSDCRDYGGLEEEFLRSLCGEHGAPEEKEDEN